MMSSPCRNRANRLARWLCSILVAALLPAFGSAAVSVDRTRLIVTESEREASPQILNEGSRPVLIQAWVDTGQAQVPAERIRAPFLVDPPIFRLEPGQSRRLRVLMVQAPQSLPRKRESVFWFNVLEIPPKPDSGVGTNHLQVSFRTRLKVFFRPAALAGRSLTDADALDIALRRESGGKVGLLIRNPSPMHRTLDTLSLIAPQGRETALEPPMLGPGQVVEMPVQRPVGEMFGTPGWRVRFSLIDDFGIAHEQEKPLSVD